MPLSNGSGRSSAGKPPATRAKSALNTKKHTSGVNQRGGPTRWASSHDKNGPSFRAHADRRADHRERPAIPKDGKSRTADRGPFPAQSLQAFKKGDFDMPMFIHGQVSTRSSADEEDMPGRSSTRSRRRRQELALS